jgi:hypothetical protein
LKKNKKPGVCGTAGEKSIQDFGGKAEVKKELGRPKNRWEKKYYNGSSTNSMGSMDWIDLARERDRRRAFVNVVMNIRIPYNEDTSCLAEELLLVSQQGLSSMELVS